MLVMEKVNWFILFYCVTHLEIREAPDLENPIRGSQLRITPYHVIIG